MDHLLFGLACLTLIGYLLTTLEFLLGNRTIQHIKDVPLLPVDDKPPRVSIIIPARNEERNIEEALTSILQLDYANYELIVLNDRSEDRTGDILERMALQHSQLRVLQIRELPHGWLGKNYALYTGAQAASGEWFLFTDADIVMAPATLQRAIHYVQTQPLDHLAIWPEVTSPSLALKIFMTTFTIFFCLYARPWRAKDPKSANFIGIGAFNLMRKSVYEAIGTHQRIALRPDDDMKLGKLVKMRGFRQAVGHGANLIRVEWYASIQELIAGLMKNAFAGLDYSLPYTLFGVSAQFLFSVWPIIALLTTTGSTWWINLAILILMQLLCFENARFNRQLWWSGLFFPVCTLLMIYIVLKATALTLWNQGIDWRGTHYPLAALKANRV